MFLGRQRVKPSCMALGTGLDNPDPFPVWTGGLGLTEVTQVSPVLTLKCRIFFLLLRKVSPKATPRKSIGHVVALGYEWLMQAMLLSDSWL